MEKYRAIPNGYMTVGELAKRMGTTVRTLQYYDKENLLKPSAESEGGRRLYTDKDMIRLHQILSLKSLGFSLEDIKEHLISLDTPNDVANVLAGQAASIEKQIQVLSDILVDIKALREEVLQMQTVDFKRYAAIITNLQMKNEQYYLIKYLDDQMLEHCSSAFDQENAAKIIETYKRLSRQAVEYQTSGVAPNSEKGIRFAEEFWNMIEKFTGGDMSLLPKLMEVEMLAQTEQTKGKGAFDSQSQTSANHFIGLSLEAYFGKRGIDPFGMNPNNRVNPAQGD